MKQPLKAMFNIEEGQKEALWIAIWLLFDGKKVSSCPDKALSLFKNKNLYLITPIFFFTYLHIWPHSLMGQKT